MNQLFTADTTTLKSNLGYQNISQYYYRMSDGKFLLTGDVYEQQVRPSRHHRAPRGQACRTAFGGTGTTLPNKKRMRTQSLRSTGSLFLCLSAT